ncbi:PRC-barrel domain-containing protein [Natronosalvus caseinilyticus]|uniref:PRC-barrel domain-containing protein n=1 Tax=Natronosalvus caseinilyticus TaxID=2953747 RepID=UPI0028A5F57A|nr:PRC-barrel domain-containing protein [Natronosalvus caseinilyticus]
MADDHATAWVTTDPNRIERWAADRHARPVVVEEGGERTYTFVHQEDVSPNGDHRELEWGAFADVLDRYDLAFVHLEDDPNPQEVGYFALTSRARVARRTGIDRPALEQALADEEALKIEIDPAEPAGGEYEDEIVPMGGGAESIDHEEPMGGGVVVREEQAPMGGGARSTPRAGRRTERSEGGDRLTATDEGKPVVDTAGERLGTVAGVTDEHLLVDSEGGLTERLRARLGWGRQERGSVSIERSKVVDVTDESVIVAPTESTRE